MQESVLRVFGIRHHGPGSARSLIRALGEFGPDIILIEGPRDATDLIPQVACSDMSPPVAMLIYVPKEPQRASIYPFAVFSPEWQAMRYGLSQGIPLRFMDLPAATNLALAQQEEADATVLDSEIDDEVGELDPRRDPLLCLAVAAGYDDGERWWEHLVEQRRDGIDLFDGIAEAMGALRAQLPRTEKSRREDRERLRESHMRKCIRDARAEGFLRVAAVCGAWHVPALAACFAGKNTEATAGISNPPAKEDEAALKGLPKLKTSCTWIPWTYGRLAFESGYGAGIVSPGWYTHLWDHPDRVCELWLTRVAQLLRSEDLDASTAQTIDAVRLAEALAALRERPLPGLDELGDACRAVFCFGNELPLRLIRDRLVIGDQLGAVPSSVPSTPLTQDLAREQKRLRLTPTATEESRVLDLRADTDLERSRLLHRLGILGIPWGVRTAVGGRGTFKEAWTMVWRPEFAIFLVDAGRLGNTIPMAATARVRGLTTGTAGTETDPEVDLSTLTGLLDRVLCADLPEAAQLVIDRIRDMAAIAVDVALLMDALPPLADVMRYGNIRRSDSTTIAGVVSGLVARICVGLAPACGSLNDEAAAAMHDRINRTHEAILLLQEGAFSTIWQEALTHLSATSHIHNLIAGRAVRLLLFLQAVSHDEAARRLGLALSASEPAESAAAWIEGFLSGSGAILVHDHGLRRILEHWVEGLDEPRFLATLPILKRTFAQFPAPERRVLGVQIRQASGESDLDAAAGGIGDLDTSRAEAVLPLLMRMLGIEEQ